MTCRPASRRSVVSRLWQADRPLTLVGILMVGAFAAATIGLALDPRTITGAPAWLKPAKFGLSTAIYAFTLAWVFGYLPDWRRTRLIVGWTTAVILALEVAIIDLQAWRGTTSHFNVAAPLDAALFAVMGTGIAAQTVASAFVALALWRQRFGDRAMGTALRAGMIITLVGASSGGLMTMPTRTQIDELHTTHRMTVSGAHTVGAPDGGAGLPATGWSREHGDLRIPHFLGLHALQAMPLFAMALRRRRSLPSPVRTVRVAAWSYAALFAIVLFRALRGEALSAPGATTVGLFATWAVLTAAGLWATARRWGIARHHRAAARA